MKTECKCKTCKNLKRVVDEKKRVHYQCPFVPTTEYLGAICNEPLNPFCRDYKLKIEEGK